MPHSVRTANGFVLVLLAAVLAHWISSFVLVENVLSPLHQDDYSVLGATWHHLHWFVDRPISTNIARVLGELGPAWAFGTLNILTVLEPAAVAWLVFELLRVRLRILPAAAFALIVFAHSSALEHAKFLGVITNLVSHGFGLAALALMLADFRRPSSVLRGLSILAYALSVFAKEDFLLPPLLLAAYFAAESMFPKPGATPAWGRERCWKVGAMLVAVAAASIVFNVLVSNPFVAGSHPAGASAPYAIKLAPSSLATSFVQLTFGYAPAATLGWIAALVLIAATSASRRREVVLLAMVTASLVLPYAVIPNRIIEYRAFAWLPWLAALPAAFAGLASEVPGGIARRIAGWSIALAVLAASVIVAADEHERLRQVATWYASAQRINRNILQTLEDNRASIAGEQAVGIIGVDGLSPWSNSDGKYLGKLGFGNRWIVYVPQANAYNAIRDGQPMAPVQVLPMARMCADPRLLVLSFGRDGTGVPQRAGALCAAGQAYSPG